MSHLSLDGEAPLTIPGFESSRMTEADEAQAIWSMALEASDSVALERGHRRILEEYYGQEQ